VEAASPAAEAEAEQTAVSKESGAEHHSQETEQEPEQFVRASFVDRLLGTEERKAPPPDPRPAKFVTFNVEIEKRASAAPPVAARIGQRRAFDTASMRELHALADSIEARQTGAATRRTAVLNQLKARLAARAPRSEAVASRRAELRAAARAAAAKAAAAAEAAETLVAFCVDSAVSEIEAEAKAELEAKAKAIRQGADELAAAVIVNVLRFAATEVAEREAERIAKLIAENASEDQMANSTPTEDGNTTAKAAFTQARSQKALASAMAASDKLRLAKIQMLEESWFYGTTVFQPHLWLKGGVPGKIARQRAKLHTQFGAAAA